MDCFSFTISIWSILLSAIVSIITVYTQNKSNENNNNRLLESDKINNEVQLKLKRLDYYYSERNSSIFNYIDSLFNYLSNQSEENLVKYQNARVKVSMYVSNDIFYAIDGIDDSIKNNRLDDVKNDDMYELISELSKDAKQYQ